MTHPDTPTSGPSKPENEARAKEDLDKHWNAFCDADDFEGRLDFTDRMEAAGLIELVPVTEEALDESFAADRGIEKGGMMWQRTEKGLAHD